MRKPKPPSALPGLLARREALPAIHDHRNALSHDLHPSWPQPLPPPSLNPYCRSEGRCRERRRTYAFFLPPRLPLESLFLLHAQPTRKPHQSRYPAPSARYQPRKRSWAHVHP